MAQHVEDIVDDCELSGLSHTVGVHVHGYERSRRRKEALASRRAFNLSLAAGDLYVFNSNRLHAVPAVIGPRDRVALGTFIGCVCPVRSASLAYTCLAAPVDNSGDNHLLGCLSPVCSDSASEILIWA